MAQVKIEEKRRLLPQPYGLAKIIEWNRNKNLQLRLLTIDPVVGFDLKV